MKGHKICFLSGNALKIIAALSMLIDHIGYVFMPQNMALRIIGRLAFPIFAFMISEGCKYTKNKTRYFLTMFSFAFAYQLIFMEFHDMSVMVTFSLSILGIFALDNAKNMLFEKEANVYQKLLACGLFISIVFFVYILNKLLSIEYGIWGFLMPVAASIPHFPKQINAKILNKLDSVPIRLLCMSIPMAQLAVGMKWVQWYSFISLLPLILYSGKRGSWNMKYFFYIFYPLHLILIYGIYYLTVY